MALQGFTWTLSQRFVEKMWDAWCIASIVGIWPRFIEPSLITTSSCTLPIPALAKEFEGLRIVQISDLHYSLPDKTHFLARVQEKIRKLEPDLIVFTGDLISYSELHETQELKNFICSLKAPLGTFAILGNHDYAEYVSLAEDGVYRKIHHHIPAIMRGFSRLFGSSGSTSNDPEVKGQVQEHKRLEKLYKECGVTLLHNESVQIGTGNARLNITGLGDIAACQFDPQKAFSGYDHRFSGIILSHNPDTFCELEAYPGDLVLCGHTHGGQVNLPWIWQRVTPLKDKRFKSGLYYINNKFIYINRGLGATFPFRWFAPPEITLITLVREGAIRDSLKNTQTQRSTITESILSTSTCTSRTTHSSISHNAQDKGA